MRVKFWGTRGTYPVPGADTYRYGGNTSCVEVVTSDGSLIILDAGTGIRALGRELCAGAFGRGAGEAYLLLSHTHWDHLQGFPFFAPVFIGGNKFHIYAPRQDAHLKSVFRDLTDEPYFPVPLDKMSATFTFTEIHPGERFSVGGARISSVRLNHPWQAVGYRIEDAGAALVYFPDTAPFGGVLVAADGGAAASDEEQRREGARALLQAATGADLLIHDATLTEAEYSACGHLGHATPRLALSLAREAGVRRLALFHYGPERTDAELDLAVSALAAEAGPVEVLGAKEGLELALGG
jgi:phosphoribosyl 1,2-cyclic phosphodiesterase